MDKRSLIADMSNKFNGAGFLNVTEIAQYLGKGRNTIPKLINGLDYIKFGKQRKYAVPDIAARLMEIRKMS